MELANITRQKIATLDRVDFRVVTNRLLRIGIFHSGKLSQVEIEKYFNTYGWPKAMEKARA